MCATDGRKRITGVTTPCVAGFATTGTGCAIPPPPMSQSPSTIVIVTVKVFQTGASYRSGQLADDPEEVRGVTEALGVRSAVVVPVDVDGTRRGCLEVNSA